MILWVLLIGWIVLSFPVGVFVGKRLKRIRVTTTHRLPPRSHL